MHARNNHKLACTGYCGVLAAEFHYWQNYQNNYLGIISALLIMLKLKSWNVGNSKSQYFTLYNQVKLPKKKETSMINLTTFYTKMSNILLYVCTSMYYVYFKHFIQFQYFFKTIFTDDIQIGITTCMYQRSNLMNVIVVVATFFSNYLTVKFWASFFPCKKNPQNYLVWLSVWLLVLKMTTCFQRIQSGMYCVWIVLTRAVYTGIQKPEFFSHSGFSLEVARQLPLNTAKKNE